MTDPGEFRWMPETRAMWEEYKFFCRQRAWATPPTVADLLAFDELDEVLSERAERIAEKVK